MLTYALLCARRLRTVSFQGWRYQYLFKYRHSSPGPGAAYYYFPVAEMYLDHLGDY